MKDANIVGNFTQNGCLTNRNKKSVLSNGNNKSSFNLVTNGFISPTNQLLNKQDSAMTEKQDNKLFYKIR